MDTDIVLFRRFPDGDVIALFPYLPAECLTAWPCQSYMHIGQHGAADPRIVHDTRPGPAPRVRVAQGRARADRLPPGRPPAFPDRRLRPPQSDLAAIHPSAWGQRLTVADSGCLIRRMPNNVHD